MKPEFQLPSCVENPADRLYLQYRELDTLSSLSYVLTLSSPAILRFSKVAFRSVTKELLVFLVLVTRPCYVPWFCHANNGADVEVQLWSSTFCSFLPCPVTFSFFLGPTIHISTCNVFSTLRMSSCLSCLDRKDEVLLRLLWSSAVEILKENTKHFLPL
jgi:hypothetical protein